jgi:hypothetical protein
MPPDQQNRTCLFMLLQFTMHSGAKVQPLSSARLRKRWLVALILSQPAEILLLLKSES